MRAVLYSEAGSSSPSHAERALEFFQEQCRSLSLAQQSVRSPGCFWNSKIKDVQDDDVEAFSVLMCFIRRERLQYVYSFCYLCNIAVL